MDKYKEANKWFNELRDKSIKNYFHSDNIVYNNSLQVKNNCKEVNGVISDEHNEDEVYYYYNDIALSFDELKYINDNYGHEEGDQLIVEAAGILVNTQLENSEIIRTDGNEFLIYLVGYSERQVATYTKKLSKELKRLPHEFGAGVGYSIINDKIKTLDDAINEALSLIHI